MRSAVGTFLLLLASAACSKSPFSPATEAEEQEVKAALAGRSFRQFDSSKDGSPRKGVIIRFFGDVGLWAQYSEGGHALDEWEIVATDYRIEQTRGGSIIRIHFTSPRSERILPTACSDCVESSGFSISIRDVFDAGRISFRVDDPQDSLPSPFPVFGSWTSFGEDIYYD